MKKTAFAKLAYFVTTLTLALSLSAHASETQTANNPLIQVSTNVGLVEIELFADRAPISTGNFMQYIEKGFYSGTIFHRVISNFMVQGGGFDADMVQKATNDPIKNESRNRLHNTRGTIAMARTNDPDSATSQFFINQRSNLQLDWKPGREGYTVFGEVIQGIDVVDFIATAPTARHRNGMADVPVDAIVITEVLRK